MAIGMHCMYCDHGPCNGGCDTYKSDKIQLSEEDKIKQVFKWLYKNDYLSDDWEIIYREFIKVHR